jgi:hypothetical protein
MTSSGSSLTGSAALAECVRARNRSALPCKAPANAKYKNQRSVLQAATAAQL